MIELARKLRLADQDWAAEELESIRLDEAPHDAQLLTIEVDACINCSRPFDTYDVLAYFGLSTDQVGPFCEPCYQTIKRHAIRLDGAPEGGAATCDCGAALTVCVSCAVADYQAAHPDCPYMLLDPRTRGSAGIGEIVD